MSMNTYDCQESSVNESAECADHSAAGRGETEIATRAMQIFDNKARARP